MRVLVLANSDIGLYKFRRELIQELLDRGMEVFISLPNGDLVSPLMRMGCSFIDTPVDRRGMNPLRDYILLHKYVKLIREIAPDLVITYTVKPNIYGGIAARICGRRYVINITGLGTAFERKGVVRSIVISLYKHALKKADRVFFENSSNCDEMLRLKCCSKEKTVVLNGAGVNTDYYLYQPYVQKDRCSFLFIGRVMKEKGIEELFEAMKRLISDGENCFLDVVGPFEDDYRELLKQYESDGWLKYHGYQEDVRPYIADCDCFVLPSYHEGMANTNLEAAASGRPVITSNIPGCKEAVVEGVTGFLCASKNSDSLYQAMNRILKMSFSQREEMGKRGRDHMIEVFSKDLVIKSTVESIFPV